MCSATATTPLFSTDHHIPKSFTRLCKPFHSRVPTSLSFHSSRPTFIVRATVSLLTIFNFSFFLLAFCLLLLYFTFFLLGLCLIMLKFSFFLLGLCLIMFKFSFLLLGLCLIMFKFRFLLLGFCLIIFRYKICLLGQCLLMQQFRFFFLLWVSALHYEP